MSRKRRQYQQSAPVAKPALQPTPKQPETERRRNWLPIVLGAVVVIALAAGGALVWAQSASTGAGQWVEGGVTSCQKTPPFAGAHGFSGSVALDTSARLVRGLLIYKPNDQGQPSSDPPPYQNPSWSSAGYLTSPKTDRDGAVYVAPVPWISVLYNPPDRANTVYRIDPQSEQMTPLVALPAGAPTNPENVYGILALTYDCDTNSLYAASVAGSTRTEEHGRLFKIDLATKQFTIVRDNIDAFGLAIYNSARGKRLYYGLARRPEVYSLLLDARGDPIGEPRAEIDFSGSGVRGDERARRIQVVDKGKLTVTIAQFDFTLTAPTNPRETLLSYDYDKAKDRWILQSSQR